MDRLVLSPAIWLVPTIWAATNLLEPPAALAQLNLLIPLGRAWQNAYASGNDHEAFKIAREAQTLATTAGSASDLG